MCGLAGLFLPDGARLTPPNMDAMLTRLHHRGPDGEGRFVSANNRYHAGFRRLAIIDVAASEQPLIDARQGRRVLMGNGEIYNYRELRADPRVADYPFQTEGDMEVVLALSSTLGDTFVTPLNGMYALALYEEDAHRLVLVRDRLGVKPLYWTTLPGGGVLFASEIKALFASGLIARAVDEGAVTQYLAHGFVPGPGTLYKGIRKLGPGQMMAVARDGKQEITQYWDAAHERTPVPDPVAATEHLVEQLRDSVRLQMRSDVPVGALLSGGIDSGLVVALAAEQSERPLKTFSVRFEGSSVDETPLAAEVAQRYGTDHTVLEVGTDSIADNLPRLIEACEEPLLDASLFPNDQIEKHLSKHVKVALNGTGGDELFAGYVRYFQLPIEQRYLRLPPLLRRNVIEPMVDRLSPMTAWKLRRAEKFEADRGGYLHDHACLFPAPIRALIGNRMAVPDPMQRLYANTIDNDVDAAGLYAEINTYLTEDLLTLVDKTTMHWSIEGRVPLLDHRVVASALSLPNDVRCPGGRRKGLLRDIARDYLPAGVIDAPKRGFASPVPAWYRGPLKELTHRILTSPRALERGWWSRAGIDALISDTENHAFRLYALLTLELSVRIHVEGDGIAVGGLEDYAHVH